MRCARNAAKPHSTNTAARATSTRLGRSQSQWATTTPVAKSHAAWNSGTALRPAVAGLSRACPEVVGSDCIAPENQKVSLAVKPNAFSELM
jgi:hypothetical protein